MSLHLEKNLCKILSETKFLTLPGIYDCLSARIAEKAGFSALFLSGGALAYSRLGVPDFGFLNTTEFGDAIKNITACVKIPLIADADNGFGNAIQSAYTGKLYEKLGASGLQIDDKVLPSTNPNKNEILPWEIFAPKIKAIRQSVSDDFTIIYRSCADLYGYGIDESIRRVNMAKDCGADYAYVDGLRSLEEIEKLSEQANLPLMINLNEKGFCGSVPIERIKEMNYSIGLFPISSMLAGSRGMMNVLGELAKNGSTLSVRDQMVDPPTIIHNMMGQNSLIEKFGKLYQE